MHTCFVIHNFLVPLQDTPRLNYVDSLFNYFFFLPFSWEWFTKMPSVCRLDQTSDVFILYSCLVHTWWTTSEQWTLGECSWFAGFPAKLDSKSHRQGPNNKTPCEKHSRATQANTKRKLRLSSSIKCHTILFIIHAYWQDFWEAPPRTVRIGRTRERSIFISSLHPWCSIKFLSVE